MFWRGVGWSRFKQRVRHVPRAPARLLPTRYAHVVAVIRRSASWCRVGEVLWLWEGCCLRWASEEPSWWGLILSISACEPHHHRPSFGLVVCVEPLNPIASVRHEPSVDAVGLCDRCGDAGKRSVTGEDKWNLFLWGFLQVRHSALLVFASVAVGCWTEVTEPLHTGCPPNESAVVGLLCSCSGASGTTGSRPTSAPSSAPPPGPPSRVPCFRSRCS
jgi:hypothetical protein